MKPSTLTRRILRIRPHWAIILPIILLLAPMTVAPQVVVAATPITVNTFEDAVANDGRCSLREAVIAANSNVASGGLAGECPAGSGADTILLPAGEYSLTRSAADAEDASATGDLDIRESVLIQGEGKVSIAAGPGFNDRLLEAITGNVTVKDVTIRGGNASLDGGGISNRAMLTLDGVTLTGNRTTGQGGGLFNRGVALLTNVTVSGNFANGSGGGIANGAGSAKSNNVTVTANTADADQDGVGDGGGIAILQGVFGVGNSIVGGNLDASLVTRHPDCSGVLASQGYNLIADPSGCTLGGRLAGNILGQDPALGPLQDNGGPTATHAPAAHSPALDAANPLTPGSGGLACAAVDQHGLARPVGPRCDMGAFEGLNDVQSGPVYQVIATVGVNDDVDDGVCSNTHCSLREAIVAANGRLNDAAPDAIHFNMVNPAGGQATIQVGSPLPAITDPVVIDGSTQPGGALVLNGANAGAEVAGLVIQGGAGSALVSAADVGAGSTLRGLVITGFGGHGVVVNGSDGNLIESNTITGNGGDGVRVLAGVANSVLTNAIYDNGGLGIDLGGNGPTPNDTGDPDEGANTLYNAPYLSRAVPGAGEVTVAGRYNGHSNTVVNIQFFGNATCDPGGAGEGQTYLGQISVTTDATGDATFLPPLAAAATDGFITATATGPAGDTSEFSNCARIGPANDSWPTALNLNLTGDPLAATYQQYLDQPGQSRWYRFAVQPESRLVVTLTDLPANYDLTVYRDIAAAFKDVTSQADLVQLGAEFAPDAFSPDAFSPDAFSPDAFSPDAFSPDAFSPDAFSPDAFSPDAFSPDAFSPDAFSPDAFSPDAFSPDAFSPDAFSPDAFSPDAFSPDAFSPDAFSSAQMRSLIAVSAFSGTAGEGISLNTHLNTGEYYVRVRGRSGAFDPNAPFTLGVALLTGVCRDVAPVAVPSSTTPVAGGYRTIVLTDPGRLEGDAAAQAALQARLAEFIARPEVQGVVVDVSSDALVAAANAQADLYTACPYAKNQVAEAVREIVDAYRDVNPLEYVVIVGGDDVIPFFRHPDQALLAGEVNYAPPVLDNTTSQASLRQNYVLSQDDYGAALEIAVKDDAFPAPGLAVGRLVETAGEASGMLAAYLATPDGVVSAPQRTLVTGYDFLEDAARAVQTEFEAATGFPADTLITPRDASPLDPASWTAQDLSAALLGQRNDLVFLAGHFSASSALAADYATRLRTSDLLAAPVDLSNTIVFSAGCHSGYNIVNAHGVPGVTQEPDWAQAFARKGATLIAGTGYQYGDTDFLKYSEELYYQFSRKLRTGAGPVAVGKALTAAKQAYLASMPQLRGIDEKALLEATLFGLPMLSINLPGERLPAGGEPPIIGGLNGYATNPGATLGLAYSDVALTPTLTQQTVQLTNVQDGGLVTATYLTGSDGVAGGPAEPVLPLEVYNVSVPNTVLRGVGFRGGAYTDLANILPLVGAATTEVRGVHAPFPIDIFYPVRLANLNYFDALTNPVDGETRVMLTPAQFKSSVPGSPTGTLRRYDRVDMRLFYSGNVSVYGGGSQPALAGAPAIVSVTSDVSDTQAQIVVRAAGNPAAGIQGVWVTYTATEGPFAGAWQSLDLTQSPTDSSVWNGVLELGATPADAVRFIVQAVNGVGLVTLDANLGAYYVPGRADQPTEPTTITVETPVSTGLYGSQVGVSAALAAGGTPLSGLPVTFRLGPQSRLAFTDGAGRATATLSLLGIPGSNALRASFGGTALYIASSSTAPFDIQKQPTALTLDLSAGNPPVTATLTDGTGRRMGEKTVFFVITGAGGSYAAAEITDYAGRAFLTSAPLPPGDYTVTAYFSGVVPLPSATLMLTDERYEPSTASASFTIAANAGPLCDAAYAVPGYLWSPDKQLHAITVMGITYPDGDPVTITITGIRQDEPVGRGKLSPDGQGVGTSMAEVRSERNGKGDGRVYHIYFAATDTAGAACNGEVRVGVTHDQGGSLDAIDGGPIYDSTIPD